MVNLLRQTSMLTPWKLYMLLTTRIIYLIEGAERVDFVTAWGSLSTIAQTGSFPL